MGDYRGKAEEDDEGARKWFDRPKRRNCEPQIFGGGNLKKVSVLMTKKTKEEIYSELIAKSKQYKAERRRQKDLDEQEMEQRRLTTFALCWTLNPQKPKKRNR